ncbi:hypothetical protein Patl1_11402 [Pistacia atlantica]|uniref:Uncharacterized protein n=1 Tax=Pistacia atlantica TaxID=434234 RepID=A0ACC1A653_9ROSI|nr:hypothetical protein Patl1_11402 [Pistacia atlantica]
MTFKSSCCLICRFTCILLHCATLVVCPQPWAMLMVGGCHVLFPKFEAKSAVEAIEQHSVTSLITVPTIMVDLITLIRKKETWKGKDNVKKILNGGGSLSVELIKDATKYFPKAKLFSAYGMTETCSSLTFTTIYDPTIETPSQLLETSGKTHCNSVHQPQGVCVGKPAPHIELKICIDGSSNVGRILTRGPHVMQRYGDHVPEKPSDSDDEAWLDTGDIGHIDNCGNIETILLRHQGVIAVVVVGIPDTRLTEMVVACVKLRDNRQWSDSNSEQPAENKQLYLCSEVLRQHCRGNNLTGYCLLNYFKIPKVFVIWSKPFPLTTTGKIRRDQVQREVMSHLKSLPSNL